MQQTIQKIRNTYTYWILLVFIPLEVLPFLCEPDSTMGKAILLIKAALFGLLYIFYADKQKWYIHVMLLIACASMGISVLIHGGAGTALLVLTMFFALITFPKIEVTKLQRIYLLLGVGAVIIILGCMISNYSKGLPAFSWRGKYNTNTIGILLLAAFFFFESALHADKNASQITYVDLLLFIGTLFLIYKSGCRSVLLSLLVFVISYFITKHTDYSSFLYLLLVLFSILICFVAYAIQKNNNISGQLAGIEVLGKDVLSGRELLWSRIIDGFVESPIFGKGIDYIVETNRLESAHSVFMGILLFGGIVPTIMYLSLIFSRRNILYGNDEKMHDIQTQRIAFMACIVVASFECVFTDNRLNILFLMLMLCNKSSADNAIELTEDHKQTIGLISNVKGNNRDLTIRRIICLTATCLMTLVFLFEPIANNIIQEKLPMLMDKEYLKEIGYDEEQTPNLLLGGDYSSKKSKGVVWEWNGSSYDVVGQTTSTTAFIDLFHSYNTLPRWITPGMKYHLIYRAENVLLRIYCYNAAGKSTRIVSTLTDTEFIIPVDTVGIIIRLALSVGKPAYESVMPIIYSLGTE